MSRGERNFTFNGAFEHGVSTQMNLVHTCYSHHPSQHEFHTNPSIKGDHNITINNISFSSYAHTKNRKEIMKSYSSISISISTGSRKSGQSLSGENDDRGCVASRYGDLVGAGSLWILQSIISVINTS